MSYLNHNAFLFHGIHIQSPILYSVKSVYFIAYEYICSGLPQTILSMENISVVSVIILFIIVILIIVKTIHFFSCVNRKKFRYWIYFNHSAIIASRSEQSKKTKRIQNVLSILLVITMLFEVLSIIINKS